MKEPQINVSPKTWDEIKTTTCYMCACRCGIKVYLKDGTVKYIEGNRDHPVNKGVICGKATAGGGYPLVKCPRQHGHVANIAPG